MTLLAEDPEWWDTVFPESVAQIRFVKRTIRRADRRILDVGCATGFLCASLRRGGVTAAGIDINSRFIIAARAKDPGGEYYVGNMRTFRMKGTFDLLTCLGTTFSYNLTNGDIAKSLRNFGRHLTPGGRVVIDVLNAVAFAGPRPFAPQTQHSFMRNGVPAVASIKHRLHLKDQCMSEQVSWKLGGKPLRRDPAERQRLFFPQELSFHLEVAGFSGVKLLDSYGRSSDAFDGRRLIAIATLARKHSSQIK